MSLTIGFLATDPLPFNFQTVLFNLGSMLADEHELHLLLGERDAPARLQPLYRTFHYPAPGYNPWNVPFAVSALGSYLRDQRPDVLINASQPFPLGFALVALGNAHGIPTVLRFTGDIFSEWKLATNPRTALQCFGLYNIAASLLFRHASLTFVLGPDGRDQLIERGFDADRVRIVPQPVDRTEFHALAGPPHKSEMKEKLGLDSDKKIILFVGRLEHKKGSDRLDEIIDGVTQRSSAFQFCLVGSGTDQARFDRFAPTHVHRVDSVERESMHQYYQAADLFILPSRREGLPNVILEALACEVPVMASPVGEIPHYTSQTADSADEYIDYILAQRWVLDPLPDILTWETQREVYLDAFDAVAGG